MCLIPWVLAGVHCVESLQDSGSVVGGGCFLPLCPGFLPGVIGVESLWDSWDCDACGIRVCLIPWFAWRHCIESLRDLGSAV